MKDFAIYVHFPFCKSRCIYCDFVSNVVSPLPIAETTRQTVAEIKARRECLQLNASPVSIYLGGGTPSLWPASALADILQSCMNGAIPSDTEITVEINPGDVDADWISAMLAAGVNRFSLGVQAMDDDRLKWLGRRHSVVDTQRAMALLRNCGASNISVDFIYATPNQTAPMIRRELDALCALQPDHISAYELTVADGTPLSQMTVPQTSDDTLAQLWSCVGDTLCAYDFDQYEVSNFARNSKRSRHNSHYWQGGPYLGIGSGAHGFIIDKENRTRYSNGATLSAWLSEEISADQIASRMTVGDGGVERLSDLDFARELVMLGLRCTSGIHIKKLRPLIADHPDFETQLSSLIEDGLLREDANRLIPTRDAMRLADELALRFF